ncbi:sporulation histidine kinase inhibitor Sda [Halalkalibacter kiskunsagensis]|uniref:Sporulation histidine kinase inhibitor Sda n=1 Tax=Halalkalibacter kiskunsagensis TaxID=1548599 RepID=A0ABV6KC05_9BACI
MVSLLDDKILLESYHEAIKLNLDREFISILKDEIKERGLYNELKKSKSLVAF